MNIFIKIASLATLACLAVGCSDNSKEICGIKAVLSAPGSKSVQFPRKSLDAHVVWRDKQHPEKSAIVGIGNDRPAIRLTYRCPYENSTVPDTRTIPQDTPCYLACNGKIVMGNIDDDEWYIMLVWEGDTIYLVCNHSRADGEPYFITDQHPYTYRRIQITAQSFDDIDFKFRVSVP